MIPGQSAEIKLAVSKKEFLYLYQTLLDRDKNDLNIEMKEQIVYFADNQDLVLFRKENLIVRYRRSNRWLEVVVKKRWITKKQFEVLEKHYNDIPNHTFKLDIDQISPTHKTLSCILKYTLNSVHQSFAFYESPYALLTEHQKDFLWKFSNSDLRDLRFLIPIQSKTFIFPSEFKEFETISLEEWRMPKLFWDKFYEITAKTSFYQKDTLDHFFKLCKKLDISLHGLSLYKTEWLYNAYFNVS